VLAELDPRSFTRIEFNAISAGTAVPGDGLVLVFNTRNGDFPVSLSAHSSDAGWARQALSSLSEEIDKGVPRWAPVRSMWGRSIVAVVVGLIAWALALAILPSTITALNKIIAAVIVGGIVGLALGRAFDWFFPPLEVTTQGSNAGTRRLAGLGLLVLSVPLGILVNLLTD
jgi:hypothetical protein